MSNPWIGGLGLADDGGHEGLGDRPPRHRVLTGDQLAVTDGMCAEGKGLNKHRPTCLGFILGPEGHLTPLAAGQ